MRSLNRVALIGRVGNTKTVSGANGLTVLISVATQDNYIKNNEKHAKTEWHNVVIFGKQAEIADAYIKKGQAIYLEGKLRTRSYEKEGINFYRTEIVINNFDGNFNILSSKEDDKNVNQQEPQNFDEFNDDIPF